MEQFEQRLIARCKVFILEICNIIVLFFLFTGGGTYYKATSQTSRPLELANLNLNNSIPDVRYSQYIINWISNLQ